MVIYLLAGDRKQTSHADVLALLIMLGLVLGEPLPTLSAVCEGSARVKNILGVCCCVRVVGIQSEKQRLGGIMIFFVSLA